MIKMLIAVAALAAIFAGQARADNLPTYNGPMFPSKEPAPGPTGPWWGLGVSDYDFQSAPTGCSPSKENYPTAERYAGNLPPIVAHFRYGADEVIVYDDKSEGNAYVFMTSEATCKAFEYGKIPLVKPASVQ